MIDVFRCNEKELAEFCLKNITNQDNNPEIDRKMHNLIMNILGENGVVVQTLDSPLKVLWKITGRCNANCKHCWAKLGFEASHDELMKVAYEIGENGVLMVSISGGEVFLREDLFEILELLKSYNILLDIMSNGTLIDDSKARKLSEILNLDTDVIQISLDGSTAKIHDCQRNAKVFEGAVQAIKRLRKYNIKVRIVFTATTINQYDLFNTYKLAGELGAQTFAPAPVFPLRKGKMFENGLDGENYIRQVAACKQLEETIGVKLRIQVGQMYQFLINKYFDQLDMQGMAWNDERVLHINETNAFMQIDSAGEVLPGPEWENEVSAGNVYKEGLMNVWKRGLHWDEFRTGRDLRSTPCNECRIFRMCQGGNMKLAYDKYKTINMPDGSCMVIKRD